MKKIKLLKLISFILIIGLFSCNQDQSDLVQKEQKNNQFVTFNLGNTSYINRKINSIKQPKIKGVSTNNLVKPSLDDNLNAVIVTIYIGNPSNGRLAKDTSGNPIQNKIINLTTFSIGAEEFYITESLELPEDTYTLVSFGVGLKEGNNFNLKYITPYETDPAASYLTPGYALPIEFIVSSSNGNTNNDLNTRTMQVVDVGAISSLAENGFQFFNFEIIEIPNNDTSIINFEAIDITPISLTLTFDTEEKSNFISYEYYQNELLIHTENDIAIKTLDIEGLTPNTEYTFKVIATDVNGDVFDAEITITTLINPQIIYNSVLLTREQLVNLHPQGSSDGIMSINFSNDGLIAHIGMHNKNNIVVNLKSPYNFNGATLNFTMKEDTNASQMSKFTNNGNYFIKQSGFDANTIAIYHLNNPYDLSNIYTLTPSIGLLEDIETSIKAFWLNSNGTKLFIIDDLVISKGNGCGNIIKQYILTTPYDFTTLNYENQLNIKNFNRSIYSDIHINEDNNSIILLNHGANYLSQYDFITLDDISTPNRVRHYSNQNLNIGGVHGGFHISKDGRKMISYNFNGKLSIHQSDLTIPFQIPYN